MIAIVNKIGLAVILGALSIFLAFLVLQLYIELFDVFRDMSNTLN